MPAELTASKIRPQPRDIAGTNNPHNAFAAQPKPQRRPVLPRTNNPQPALRREMTRRKPRNSSKSGRSLAPPAPDRRRSSSPGLDWS